MSNEAFFCTAKIISENGRVYSFGNNPGTKTYCVLVHTEYERMFVFTPQDEYEVIDLMEGRLTDLFGNLGCFQKFKDFVLNEMMFITRIKSQNDKFSQMKLLGPINLSSRASQFLWKKRNEYIVTSWTLPPMGGPVEILAFISDEEGMILDWTELAALYSVPDLVDNHKIVAEKAFGMLR
jgi:hypothetical protein